MIWEQDKPVYYPHLPLKVSKLRDLLWLLQDAVDLEEVEVGEFSPDLILKPMFNLACECRIFPYGTAASVEGWCKIVGLWPDDFVDDPELLDLVYDRPYPVSKAKGENTFWWLFGAFWSTRCGAPIDVIRRLDYWAERWLDEIIPMVAWNQIKSFKPERTFAATKVGVEEFMAVELAFRRKNYKQ